MAKGPSPLSTGGAGTIYEYHVAALDLVALLSGAEVPGLDVVPDTVGLQKASTDPLDDIVSSNNAGPRKLSVERQAKRTLTILPSEKAWKGLIRQCCESLERFGEDIDAERRRLGVTATGPVEELEQLSELAAWAGAQPTHRHFVDEALPPVGQQYHRLWGHVKSTVSWALTEMNGGSKPSPEEVEESAFRIVRRLVVEIEPEEAGARYTYLCAVLAERLLPQDGGHDAAAVFGAVEDIAQEWGRRGGTITRTMLRDRLRRQGIVLRGDPPARADLDALAAHTNGLLEQHGGGRIGGQLRLERAAQLADLVATIGRHPVVLVTGPAGTGKSTLARAGLQEIRASGTATVAGLSLTEHNWRTVADVDAHLGRPAGGLASALQGAPTGTRVLLVDGAEQALSDDGNLLRELLDCLPRGEDGEALWHVVAVTREQGDDRVHAVLAGLGLPVETVEVSRASDGEQREILAAFPALAPLARSERTARLLGNLYTVDMLVRLAAVGADPGDVVGEEDVAGLVLEELVRRGGSERPGLGHPDDRITVFLELAQAVVDGERFARLASVAGPARQGLVSDGILRREYTSFGFAHDVMQDYAVAALLCDSVGAGAMARAPQARRLLRAVRIAAQLRLARATGRSPRQAATAWAWVTDTTRSLAEREDETRWLDLPYEALFELGRPEPVLSALAEVLLEDGGRALVDAARLRLRGVAALAVVAFLVRHAPDLDSEAAAGALDLLRRWLPEVLPAGGRGLAAAVPGAVTKWAEATGARTEAVAVALALTAMHLDGAAKETFKAVCDSRPVSLERVLETPSLAGNVARHAPDILAHAALACYLGLPREHFMEGVRDFHRHYGLLRKAAVAQLPEPAQLPWVRADAPDPAFLGPFDALFTHSPQHALAVAGPIIDAATQSASRISTPRDQRVYSLTWPLAQGSKTFTGTARTWHWPWAETLGPTPAVAAAARLRRWAHDQAAGGADLSELVHQVLGCGTSIALVAITVEVLTLHAGRLDGELDALLGQPDLWELPPSPDRPLLETLPALVLSAPADRQGAYQEMSRNLHAYAATLPAAEKGGRNQADAVVEAALLLDRSNYRPVGAPERRWVNVAVEARREAALRDAPFSLDMYVEGFALLNDAERVRDRAEDADTPQAEADDLFERWSAFDEACRARSVDHPMKLGKIGPLVAAAVLKTATVQTPPAAVQWAAGALLTAAAYTPDAISAPWDTVTDALADRAPDRSAAVGLPHLLADPALLHAAGVTAEAVHTALLHLARSACAEVRTLLGETLTKLWAARPCEGPDDVLHAATIGVMSEMAATAGLAPAESDDEPRRAFRLPDPVEGALTEGTAHVDLRLAADAAALAWHTAAFPCVHAETARQLARALGEHDRLTWTHQCPAMATHSAKWRRIHDAAAAQAALDGDSARLDGALDAFAATPDALAGLLRALAQQATTRARVRRLVALWPAILDRFGASRSAALGEALLPQPPLPEMWTPAQVRGIVQAWAEAQANRPNMTDHLLVVLEAHALSGPRERRLVFDVLGDQPDAIALVSERAPAFLAQVLADGPDPAGADASRARRLLDALAAQGHQQSLRLQHHLEEAPGPE
ncbi:hypothetical protein [Kitasatospora purpeofusca]|uniref:hypothetical protein n=1 Tax=Kitasatospora purpeofusca TaxID=67352 RepID=UPI0035D6E328